MAKTASATQPTRGAQMGPPRTLLSLTLAWTIACATGSLFLFAKEPRQPQPPASPPANLKPTEDKPVREIFVPFEDLPVLLEGVDQRVLLTREEYAKLLQQARIVPAEEDAPESRVLVSADYETTVEDGRATTRARLEIELLSKELLAIPLSLRGVTLRNAAWDGVPALLGQNADGQPVLFARGVGKHQLVMEFLSGLETAAAQQTLALQLPIAAGTIWKVAVPGNVEVKSGAQVIRRVVEEEGQRTQFELLPQRDPMRIVMSLNNRILLQQQVVLARSLLIDELTKDYDRLHATISLAIPHGAVERFRFSLPAGYDVTEVQSPLLARWSEERGAEGARTLEVLLREATRESVVVQVTAVRHTGLGDAWTMPQLRPLDVANHVAVVGLLLDERLAPQSLTPTNLIPIDTQVLAAALPEPLRMTSPDAPRVRAVAAYYAPQADFQLAAKHTTIPAKFETTSNLLFTLTDRQVSVRAGFAIRPTVERVFLLDFPVPPGWKVHDVTQEDGKQLPWELFVNEGNVTRLQVRLPQGANPNADFNLFLHATSTPTGWLNDWSQTTVALPPFTVTGASRDSGAVAVQLLDDLLATPEKLNGLTPLDRGEQGAFGWEGIPTSLAYRYESQQDPNPAAQGGAGFRYELALKVERPQPRVTARVLNFLRVDPADVIAHYEVLFTIEQARARRLSLRLPADTPEALSIRGLNVNVKEFRAERSNGDRVWNVELAEPTAGTVILAVDFEQPLPLEVREVSSIATSATARNVPLPLLRATGVAYQSGAIAVEGNMEFDVEVKTDLRKVDVGELADAHYQVGKRLLGAFGYVNEPGVLAAAVSRRGEFGLPSAITQRAELVTSVSPRGVSQTAARFQLRTKAPFLEIALPAESSLWAVMVGGKPVSPQRFEDRVLVGLETGSEEVRDLQLVYETRGGTWDRWGRFNAVAPRLMLRNESGTERFEVPLADLEWHLLLPEGQQVVRVDGSVFAQSLAPQRSPAWTAARAAAGILGAFGYAARSATTAIAPRTRYRNDAEIPSDKYFRDDVKYFAAPGEAAPMKEMSEPQSAPLPPSAADSPAVPPPAPAPVSESKPQVTDLESNAQTTRALRLSERDAKQEPDVEATNLPTLGVDKQPKGVASAEQFWALQGVRSLPVEIVRSGESLTFRSLGVSPELRVTLASEPSLRFLSAALAIVVAAMGLLRTPRPIGQKISFVWWGGLLSLGLPHLIGMVMGLELTRLFAPSFYVVCLLAVWFVVAGIASVVVRGGRRLFAPRASQAIAASVACLALLQSEVSGQEPTLDQLRDLLRGQPPVKIPADAVVIPYDPADPVGPQRANKVFVPYTEYVRLWDRANPSQPLTPSALPVPFAVGGASYRATLGEDESLLVTGKFTVEVFASGPQAIPLTLKEAVLTRMTVDGRAALLEMVQPVIPMAAPPQSPAPPSQQAPPPQQAVQPPPPLPPAFPAVRIEGIGRHEVELEMRFKVTRSGGWRLVDGRVPASSATALDLAVPKAKTQVRVGHSPAQAEATENSNVAANWAEFNTERDLQNLPFAIPSDGALRLEWRPQVTEAQVDQSLTARSLAVLDVREDALRLVWQVELQFRRGQRDRFAFTVPGNLLLEKVLGDNVRGWKSTPAGDQATIDVTLLKPVTGSETVRLVLSRREAPGGDAMRAFSAAAVSVVDAALHQGVLVVRRSPQLELRVDASGGLSRADSDDQAVEGVLAGAADESPLGVRTFQTYRFAATPFDLRLQVSRISAPTSIVAQEVLKVMERESRWEARLLVSVENRPRYQLSCRLPVGLRLDEVSGVSPVEWTTTPANGGDLLNVWLPRGEREFALVLRGRLPQQQMESFPAPTLEVLDVERQSGQLVVQADPGLEVRAEALKGCEQVLLERVFGWLQEAQRPMARFALAHRDSQYGATLRVLSRQARVRGLSISNSRVTSNTIEDTIYLQFTILDAGIRSLKFRLPTSLREARITAPLLRRKTIEPIADDPNHLLVSLDLQDEVTNQFVVLVTNDRPLSGGRYDVPVPVLETGETEQRYLVWENAGRDEVSVASVEQLDELNRQQAQWGKLAEVLGDKILRAYSVREGATSPRLQLETKQRATVQTAGARIGLAQTVLVVDSHGAYRAIQQYHVDNRTEQYLEVELPEGAALWTTRVANEPVKPVVAAGTGTGTGTASGAKRCFIPLIKTAAGDLDYVVELKYAGKISWPRGVAEAEFPFPHTKNIRVELSQVRLFLPEDRRCFDLGGSMRLVRDEGELVAGYFSYQSKQVSQLLDLVRDGESFTKIRAADNLRQLGQQLRQANSSYSQFGNNSEFQRELGTNEGLLREAEEVVQQQAGSLVTGVESNNRLLLLGRSQAQTPARAKNQVYQLQSNFDSGVERMEAVTETPANLGFNSKWFDESRFGSIKPNEPAGQSPKDRNDLNSLAKQPAKPSILSAGEKREAATKLGRKLSEVERMSRGNPASQVGQQAAEDFALPQVANEAAGQAERYRQRLEVQNRGLVQQHNVIPLPQQTLGGVVQPPTTAMPGGMGGMGGVMPGAPGYTANAPGVTGVDKDGFAALAGMASLDVTLPQRGVEYKFTTPGGEIAVTARSIDADQARHARVLGLLSALGIVGWFVGRRYSR